MISDKDVIIYVDQHCQRLLAILAVDSGILTSYYYELSNRVLANDETFVTQFESVIAQSSVKHNYVIAVIDPLTGGLIPRWETVGHVFWIGLTLCLQSILKAKLDNMRRLNETHTPEFKSLLNDYNGNQTRVFEKLEKCCFDILQVPSNIIRLTHCIDLVKSFSQYRFWGEFGTIGLMKCMTKLNDIQKHKAK